MNVADMFKNITIDNRFQTHKNSNGGTVLFSEFGARIVGLFPLATDPNTLWIPDDLSERINAGDWVLGGERLWIAPQRDYFFKKPIEFEDFFVDNRLDPGNYHRLHSLSYQNSFSLHNGLMNIHVKDCISKREFDIIDYDPYESNLPFIGVHINDSISMSTQENIPFCAWSITMVPTIGPTNPGTVILPISQNAFPINYFEAVPSERISNENKYVRFLIDSKKAYKIAISPDGMVKDNSVRVIYVSPFKQNDRWFCLVKRSNDLPVNQSDCVDPPSGDPDGPKGAIQAYNHGYGSDQHYGEIELQFKKCSSTNKMLVSSGSHELLSYTGTRNEILYLVKSILQIDNLPLIF